MFAKRVGPVFHALVILAASGLPLAGCGMMHVRAPNLALACGTLNHGEVPRSAAAASRIARHDLAEVVGEPAVLRQEPFVARFDDYRWVVRGTLPPGETQGRYLVVLDAKTGCSTFAGPDDPAAP